MTHPISIDGRRSFLRTAGTLGASAAFGQFVVHDAVAQTTIPIGMTTGLRLANYGPLYVAARRGLFEKQGLKVTIDTGGSVAEPVAIALSGRGPVCCDWNGHGGELHAGGRDG